MSSTSDKELTSSSTTVPFHPLGSHRSGHDVRVRPIDTSEQPAASDTVSEVRISSAISTLVGALLIGLFPQPASASPTGAEQIRLRQIVGGLSTPVDLRAPRGDDRLFIAELPGRIRIYENGSLLPSPFLDIQARVSTGGERGLQAMAFHPNYEANGLFYVYYTDNGGDVRISEFEVSSNEDLADVSSERIVLEVDQPASNHNGGGLAFGPAGYLYIALGDGGGGGDPGEHGQNPNTLLGSLLRIDVDTTSAGRQYGIPPSNPLSGGGGAPEVFAFGLRNPFRISVDHRDERIYIGDVGQDRREEIDVLDTGETQAVNFGWDVMEGSLCFEPPSGCNTSGKTLPILEYANPSEGVSVIGGYVYRGHQMPWLRGTYFYSDLGSRRLMSFRYTGGAVFDETDWTAQVGQFPSSVYSFGEDGFGELYVMSGSSVYRIEPDLPGKCDFNGDRDDDLPAGIPGEDLAGLTDAGALMVLPSRSMSPGPDGDQLWHQDDEGIKSVARTGESFGQSLACGDFDGDGYDDLAIGTPNDRHQGGPDGGAVNVLYGTSSGLSEIGDQLFHQNTSGVGGRPEAGDGFGSSLAAGDFNGDGYHDLAIGVPGEDVNGIADAGMIHVLYGSASGLSGSGSLSWYQDTDNIKGVGEEGDAFGSAVTTGDFNGDGYADLVVSAPGEDIDGMVDAGMVHVFPGSLDDGPTVFGDVLIEQNQPGIKGSAEQGDRLGTALSAGPITADGYDDLIIGVPGEGVHGHDEAGMILFVPGSRSGVTDFGDRLIHQDTPGIKGTVESGDLFGSSVAVGDVDGDGFSDIAIGTPGEDVFGIPDAGSVSIIFGAHSEPSARDQLWHQDDPGVLGVGERNDRFGELVGLLDFERDGRLDLVVGIPSEDLGGILDAGDLAILFGRSSGLSASGDLRLNQGTTGMQGTPESGDRLGAALPS